MDAFGSPIYAGAWGLRRSLVQFLQYLFGNLDLTAEFRWDTEDSDTKLYIEAAFKVDEKHYPSIVVDTVRPDTKPLSLGSEKSWERDIGLVSGTDGTVTVYELTDPMPPGTVTGYAKAITVHSTYECGLKVSSFGIHEAERISDLILLMFRASTIRDKFTRDYGAFITGATAVRRSDIRVAPIPGGSQTQEYSISLSFSIFWQGEIILPLEEITTIESERFILVKIPPV